MVSKQAFHIYWVSCKRARFSKAIKDGEKSRPGLCCPESALHIAQLHISRFVFSCPLHIFQGKNISRSPCREDPVAHSWASSRKWGRMLKRSAHHIKSTPHTIHRQAHQLKPWNSAYHVKPGIDESKKSKFESRKRNLKFWSRILRVEREIWDSDLEFRE